MGIGDDRITWKRLYADEVDREGDDLDAAVRRMAGAEDRTRRRCAPPANSGYGQELAVHRGALPVPGSDVRTGPEQEVYALVAGLVSGDPRT
jgi:hypothetical protein